MSALTIGRLARAAGVNVETIRYYQRRGLLRTPRRPPGGVRVYSADSLEQLNFIKRAQQLGFSLRDIRELLALGSGQCEESRQLAEAHLLAIEQRLRDLRRMRTSLTRLIRRCREGREPICPIAATLASPASGHAR
jgi:MerR family mercuric resistance operon transcriptional regulator